MLGRGWLGANVITVMSIMEVDYLLIDMTKMAESNFLTQPRFLTLVSKLARLFNVAWQITYWLYSKTVANATLQEYGNDVY